MKKFNTGIADSQATPAEAVSPEDFDPEAYADYAQWLQERGRAFSEETDPNSNPPEPFRAFANTDIVLNARVVGDAETVIETVKRLWTPGMKLIVVTYCQTPGEQEMVYDGIHEICV